MKIGRLAEIMAVKYKVVVATGPTMSQHGWWILPDGTIMDSVESHEKSAREYLASNNIDLVPPTFPPDVKLIRLGGIAIRPYSTQITVEVEKLDDTRLRRIKDFIRQHFQESDRIDIWEFSSETQNRTTVGEFLESQDRSPLEKDYTTKWASLDIGTTLRSRITNLSNIINKTHGILRECSDSDAKNPKNEREASAVEGFEFIKKVVGMIDYLDALKDHQSPESLKDIYLAALILKETIEKNLATKHEGRDVQFPHVSDLIWEMKPLAGKKWDDFRKYESAKARGGLARIMSIAIDMLKNLKDAGIDVGFGKVEDDDRFKPQRAELSSQEIIPFLLEYGPEYGIENTDEWMKVLESDKGLKSKLTTIINALNRGHSPVDASGAKKQIREILEGYRAGRREPIGEPKIGNSQYLGMLERKYL